MEASEEGQKPPARKISYWFIACIVLVFLSLLVRLVDPGIPSLVLSGMTIIPLAFVMGRATEELAAHMGPNAGGLLNATFGNATELIIAIFALSSGLVGIVQASITGSIIGNLLLVLGLSMLAGGSRRKEQKFDSSAATTRSTMLTLAVVALILPSMFVLFIDDPRIGEITDTMSIVISVILIAAYILGLVFSLKTHRHFYNPVGEESEPVWSKKRAILILVLATLGVAVMSEMLVGSIELSIDKIGLSEIFIGVVIIATVGNAAEHGGAVVMAWKNKMNLSVGIAASSSTQIALFVAPVLVFISHLFAEPMTLAFEIFEILAIALCVAIVHMVSADGKSNWYEGVLLLMVYAILAVGFFFHP